MHDEPADRLVGALVAERYRITRKLGEGGMGSVYEAEHELIGKRVALKCLNPELTRAPEIVERFRREARAATAVGNEHIVDVTDFGTLPDGSPFMVMEHLDGVELGNLVESEGPLPIGRACRIVKEICEALGAAHEKGVVHRDLKPENVFLVRRGGRSDFVKVLDFGISKFTEPEKSAHLTRTGVTMGTPHYMSPEQAQGLASMDHRTDIYAIGVILFRLLAGVEPFDGATFPMLMVQIVTVSAPLVTAHRPDVPEALAHVIRCALEKDPHHRYQTAFAFAEALSPFVALDAPPPAPVHIVRSAPGPDAATVAERRPAAVGVVSARPPDPARAATLPVEVTKPMPTDFPVTADPRGGDTRELVIPKAAMRPRALVLGSVAVVVLLAAAFALRPTPTPTTSAPPIAQTPEPAGQPVEAPSATEVRVTLVARPSGARVFIGGTEYPNPWMGSIARTLVPTPIRIEAAGYDPVDTVAVFDGDKRLEYALTASTPDAGARSPSSAIRPATPPPTTMEDMDAPRHDGFRDDF